MSSGIFLFLDLKGESVFDAEKVRACLKRLPGIRNWDEDNPRHPFFCEFDFNGDRTIVHMLATDLQFISVEGVGDASLQVALEIQKGHGQAIHAVDTECCFDIPLSEVSSLADFKDKTRSDWGRENLSFNPKSRGNSGKACELRSVRQRSQTLSLFVGGSIGLVLGFLWSICGRRVDVILDTGHWFFINTIGLTFSGIAIGAIQRSPQVVGLVTGLVSLSLLVAVFRPWDGRIVLPLPAVGVSGGVLGSVIGSAYLLVYRIKR